MDGGLLNLQASKQEYATQLQPLSSWQLQAPDQFQWQSQYYYIRRDIERCSGNGHRTQIDALGSDAVVPSCLDRLTLEDNEETLNERI